MIRIARMRTGVEVQGSENDSIVDIDPPTYATHLARLVSVHGFTDYGQNTVAHPGIWVHDILHQDNDTVLGQLVLVDADLFDDLVADSVLGMNALDVKTKLFAGLERGHEYWLWLSLQDPSVWPSFRLRGAEYPTALLGFGQVTGVHVPMDEFDMSPQTSSSIQAGQEIWSVTTDGLPNNQPVAIFTRSAGSVQRWWAHRDYLVARLLPPDSNGIWHFTKVSALPSLTNPALYVPLLADQHESIV